MEKECLYCNKLFQKKVNCSLKDWNERTKYCSKDCYTQSMKGKRPLCIQSKGVHLSPKTEFKKGQIPWNKGKTGFVPWNKKKKIECTCLECGKKVMCVPYRAKTFKVCSSKCVSKHYLAGEKHWNFKNWSTNKLIRLRSTAKYKEWRETVMKRDNYTCRMCKQKGGKLCVDHIKPFAYFPEERFNLDNGRVLCIECHQKTDTFLSGALKYKHLIINS